MKKTLLILSAICLSFSIYAQELTIQKEIGLLFNSLNNFGIGYKVGTSNALWRFNTLLLTGSKFNEEVDDIKRERNNFGFNLRMGREDRKEVAKNLEIRYGGDILFGYNYNKNVYTSNSNPNQNNYTKRKIYSMGVGVVFGFNYVVNNSLIIGAELLPSVSYNTGKNYSQNGIQDEVVGDISGFNYGISNTSAIISVSYRF